MAFFSLWDGGRRKRKCCARDDDGDGAESPPVLSPWTPFSPPPSLRILGRCAEGPYWALSPPPPPPFFFFFFFFPFLFGSLGMGVRFNPVRFLVDDATKKLIVNDCFFFFFLPPGWDCIARKWIMLLTGFLLSFQGIWKGGQRWRWKRGLRRQDETKRDIQFRQTGSWFWGGVGGGRTGNPAQSTFS